MKIKVTFFKPKYYESIETLPAWNWFKISETNDLSYLCFGKQPKNLQEIWSKITFEFIEYFGISPHMKQVFETQRKILQLETRVALENRKDLTALIEIESSKLKKLSEKENEKKINTVVPFVSKQMGFHIDTKKISTKDFFEYLKMIEQNIEAQTRENKPRKHGRK